MCKTVRHIRSGNFWEWFVVALRYTTSFATGYPAFLEIRYPAGYPANIIHCYIQYCKLCRIAPPPWLSDMLQVVVYLLVINECFTWRKGQTSSSSWTTPQVHRVVRNIIIVAPIGEAYNNPASVAYPLGFELICRIRMKSSDLQFVEKNFVS